MKRLYDLLPIQEEYNNGGGEYCKKIFYQLVCDEKAKQFEFLLMGNKVLDREIEDIISINNLTIRVANSKKEINKIINEYDLFYSALPYMYYYLKLQTNVKFVYTIHGLRDIEMPYDKYYLAYENYRMKAFIKTCLHKIFPYYLQNKARRKMQQLLDVTSNRQIYVVSNHTKFSLLVNFSNVKSEEVKVCYSPEKIYNGNLLIKENFPEDFLLLVSGDRWIKNNLRAVIAIDELISAGRIKYKVIITGVKNEKVYRHYIKNENYFIFKGYVSSNELESLYKYTKLFIFPSLNEGFGYPPLEAMKYSTICICAADTSIPEVCGNAVLYFNPYNILELKTRVIQALDSNIRENLREKIGKQLEKICYLQKKSLIEMIDNISQ